MLSASGGASPPDHLTRGFAPGLGVGAQPQTPIIGSLSRARHVPHSQIASDAPVGIGFCYIQGRQRETTLIIFSQQCTCNYNVFVNKSVFQTEYR